MNLVRMTLKGVPKFIRTTGVTRIAVDEDGTRVDYEPEEFDYVDGTPDEVFKALFNPPETIEKAKVDAALSIKDFMPASDVERIRFHRGPLPERVDALLTLVERFRERLGLPKVSVR